MDRPSHDTADEHGCHPAIALARIERAARPDRGNATDRNRIPGRAVQADRAAGPAVHMGAEDGMNAAARHPPPPLIDRIERAERAIVLIAAALGPDLRLSTPMRARLARIANDIKAEQQDQQSRRRA